MDRYLSGRLVHRHITPLLPMPARQSRLAEGGFEAEATSNQECDMIVGPVLPDIGCGRGQLPGLVDVVLWDVCPYVDFVREHQWIVKRVRIPWARGRGQKRTRNGVPRTQVAEVVCCRGREDEEVRLDVARGHVGGLGAECPFAELEACLVGLCHNGDLG